MVRKDGAQIAVAEGRVYPTAKGELVHNEPLPADCCKGCLDRVLEGCDDHHVPCPLEENQPEVRHHIGGFVKWPRCLVRLPGQV